MSLSEKYKDLLKNLFPQGKLWEFGLSQPVLDSLLGSLAEEFCRVDTRVQDMLRESDPSQTTELLEDWERVAGLPDPCDVVPVTIGERRDALVQKLTNIGGLSKSFFEFAGLQLGFTITVLDYKNFRAGFSVAGDPLTNYFHRHFEAGDLAGTALQEFGWRFYFHVEAPLTLDNHFVAGSFAGDPLREFGNPAVECMIMRTKPAHSAVFFTYV